MTVVVMGPFMGWAFDRLIFRRIANSNTVAKMVCSLALLVGIPNLMPVFFGNQNLDATASILPFFDPNTVYFTLWNTPINGIYLSTISVTAVVLVLLTILLRYTNLGLQMRAAVESRRLVQLDGVNANAVVSVAWMVSGFMASLVGVLLAPVYGAGAFTSDDYVILTVTAIAAAAWALLRSLPIAAAVGIGIGVFTTVLQGYIPPNSFWNAAVVPSIPFVVIVAALLILPGMRNLDSSRDPLATIDPPPPPIAAASRAPTMDKIIRPLWWLIFAGFCVSMLTWIPDAWTGVFNSGLTYSIVLLSITLITGMAGQLSLCQATLAGVGAFTAAQLANHLGLNLLLGGLLGAAVGGRGRGHLGASLAPPTRARAGTHDPRRRLVLRRYVLQHDFHHRRIPGCAHPVQVARNELILQLRRARHVLVVSCRARRRGRYRPAGAQGDGRPQPGRHARERNRDGGARA